MNKIYFLILLTFFITTSCCINSKVIYQDECVILLHGIGDVKLSMSKLENDIKKAGFNTINIGYPANGKKIEMIADNELSKAIEKCRNYEKIHIVTHSMGALVTRYYLNNHKLPEGSRIVMLSPPNKGSEVADYFQDSKLYELFYGEAGRELETNSAFLKKLKPINYQVGIIAGSSSTNPFLSRILPGKDDGRVSVENMKLNEMKDFIVISTTHLLIKYNKQVANQTINFLINGKFDHDMK